MTDCAILFLLAAFVPAACVSLFGLAWRSGFRLRGWATMALMVSVLLSFPALWNLLLGDRWVALLKPAAWLRQAAYDASFFLLPSWPVGLAVVKWRRGVISYSPCAARAAVGLLVALLAVCSLLQAYGMALSRGLGWNLRASVKSPDGALRANLISEAGGGMDSMNLTLECQRGCWFGADPRYLGYVADGLGMPDDLEGDCQLVWSSDSKIVAVFSQGYALAAYDFSTGSYSSCGQWWDVGDPAWPKYTDSVKGLLAAHGGAAGG